MTSAEFVAQVLSGEFLMAISGIGTPGQVQVSHEHVQHGDALLWVRRGECKVWAPAWRGTDLYFDLTAQGAEGARAHFLSILLEHAPRKPFGAGSVVPVG